MLARLHAVAALALRAERSPQAQQEHLAHDAGDQHEAPPGGSPAASLMKIWQFHYYKDFQNSTQ